VTGPSWWARQAGSARGWPVHDPGRQTGPGSPRGPLQRQGLRDCRCPSAGGYGQVGFEPSVMTVELLSALRRKAKGVRWKPLPSELGSIRAVKDPTEIEHIRKAIRIATRALRSTLVSIRPGVCELDIAIELEYEMRQKGAEAPSFDTIIASGPNSALPHARPADERFGRGTSWSWITGPSAAGTIRTKPAPSLSGRPGSATKNSMPSSRRPTTGPLKR